jgi:hypothetical protein
MPAARWLSRVGAALLVLAAAGCSGKELKPGVTYETTVLTRGANGKAEPQGPATRVESVVVGHTQDITHDGHTLVLTVRKTEYERATFDAAFPDKAHEMVRVKKGESKDLLPQGQALGVRIRVEECR